MFYVPCQTNLEDESSSKNDICMESILTSDMLKRSKILVNRCSLCKKGAETCNHILLWCLVVYIIWTMVYGLLGLNEVIVGSVKEEIWAWQVYVTRGVIYLYSYIYSFG